MESLLTLLIAHQTTAIVIYCLIGLIAVVGYAAVPLRARFPRFAGIIECCRAVGPDLKKLGDGIALILFGKTPVTLLEGLTLVIKRWTTTAGVFLTLIYLSGCGAAQQQLTEACPVPNQALSHVKLAVSLAKIACDSAPLTDEQLEACDEAVELAGKAITTTEEARKQACNAWPYIENVSILTKNEKLDAAIKLGAVILQCEGVK